MYIAQSVRSLYLRSPRSAAPMQDGAAGAAQIEDNLGVKQDAAVDVGRTENDIRASRRCELPLSRVSSTDEAQLESGTFFSVRRDLAVSTPYLRSRRHVTPRGRPRHTRVKTVAANACGFDLEIKTKLGVQPSPVGQAWPETKKTRLTATCTTRNRGRPRGHGRRKRQRKMWIASSV